MDFIPPFCPNRDCRTHREDPESPKSWFLPRGYRMTKVVGPVRRFQCRFCRKGFSSRTFDIDYWVHRPIDYEEVRDLLVGGSGLRQSCRTLGVSTRLLANRQLRLCRQSLALHSLCLEDFRLNDSLVLDGFESFAYSQYYPNNLHLLVTSSSQFALGFHGAVLRRKGRMTDKQRERRKELEEEYRAPGNAIFRSSRQLLAWGCDLSFGSGQLPIRIISDKKKECAWALAKIEPYNRWRDEGLLVHTRIDSKAPRTLANPLFPVNYLDRQLRKDLAEHVREGVRFARRIEHSLERAVVHLVHHNYFKVFRNRSKDKQLTHAEMAGIDRTLIEKLRERSLKDRAFGWRVNLEPWQMDLWCRRISVPVHPTTPVARHLMTA